MESHASLRIHGELLLPEAITERVRLNPSRVGHKGQRRGTSALIEKDSWWEIGSRLSRDNELSKHVDDVLFAVAPAASTIASLATDFEVVLSCVLYVSAPPELWLSSDQIRAIGQLGAALDIDLILVPS
jgi:hypothetical protein